MLSVMMIMIDGVAAASSGTQDHRHTRRAFLPLPLTAPGLCMMLSKVSSDCMESVML